MAKIAFRRLQLTGCRIVFDLGGIGLLPLLIQLFVHLADHMVEEGGKTAPFQPIHIGLLRQLHGLQLTKARGENISLGLQLLNLGRKLAETGNLLLQCFQLFIIIRHTLYPPVG